MTDLRELVLLSLYPEHIPTGDYGRVINLISALAVKMLSEGKLKPPGAKRKSVERGTVRPRVEELLAAKPRTLDELVEATGGARPYVGYIANELGAKRDDKGYYRLAKTPKTTTSRAIVVTSPVAARTGRWRQAAPGGGTFRDLIVSELKKGPLSLDDLVRLTGKPPNLASASARKVAVQTDGKFTLRPEFAQ